MYFEDKGAFTGEISPLMLKDMGATHVILGHSERRHIFGETDALIGKKMKAALSHGLTPVLCVGEKLEARKSGATFSVVREQILSGLAPATHETVEKIIIAYEPVWAIGTGWTATPEQANEVHGYIRGLVSEKFGEDVARRIPILYGGSVKPENAYGLIKMSEVDGFLVGGASLKADSFLKIIDACKKMTSTEG